MIKLQLKKTALCLFTTITCNCALAADVHTWHNIYAQNGVWEGKLQSINQEASFVKADGSKLTNFLLSAQEPLRFGFAFDKGADFNIAYTITLVQKDKTSFSSPACVFVVTADGPRKPDIRAFSYHGASCYTKSEAGTDFYVG